MAFGLQSSLRVYTAPRWCIVCAFITTPPTRAPARSARARKYFLRFPALPFFLPFCPQFSLSRILLEATLLRPFALFRSLVFLRSPLFSAKCGNLLLLRILSVLGNGPQSSSGALSSWAEKHLVSSAFDLLSPLRSFPWRRDSPPIVPHRINVFFRCPFYSTVTFFFSPFFPFFPPYVPKGFARRGP